MTGVTPAKNIVAADVVWIDPERMSGPRCFTRTPVPVQALLDHLKTGSTLDDFFGGGLRDTPAMEAGVADHVWSLEEVVSLLD